MSIPAQHSEADRPSTDQQLQGAAARIEALVAELGQHPDPAVRSRARELVRLLMRLYGAGLARIATLLGAGADDNAGVRALLADDLVASLLALHDLHPDPVEERIRERLARLGRLAGLRILLEGVADGVARVRVEAGQGISSHAAGELRRRLDALVAAAAPELSAVEVEGIPGADAPVLVQIGSIPRRPGSRH